MPGKTKLEILITGGAGFIGSHLARALLFTGNSVRVLDDLSTGREENLAGLQLDFQIADLRDPTVLVDSMKDVDQIFHLGAYISAPGSVVEPETCYETNIMGSLRVLAAAQQAGVRRVVLASSAAVYGDTDEPCIESRLPNPMSPYAASKISMEETAKVFTREFGLETVCLRFFNVFGPRQDPDSPYAAVIPQFINDLEVGKGITIFGDGQQTRDFVFVEDVIQACLLAMDSDSAVGETINIANGKSNSILELAGILQGFYPEAPEVQFGAPRAGDVRFSQANITKAREALGYRPKTELEEGLRHTVEWFKSNRR
jgi:nucleoside-diphosphate-sugar epimerase